MQIRKRYGDGIRTVRAGSKNYRYGYGTRIELAVPVFFTTTTEEGLGRRIGRSVELGYTSGDGSGDTTTTTILSTPITTMIASTGSY